MSSSSTWAVDAVTVRRVRLVADHDSTICDLPRRDFRHLSTLTAGDVIAVTSHPTTGEPDWTTALVVEGEGGKRKAAAARMLSKLQGQDTGGDLEL